MPLSVDELSELDEGDPTRTSGGSGSYIFDAVAKGGDVPPATSGCCTGSAAGNRVLLMAVENISE